MATLHVDNVPDEILNRLAKRAAQHGRSLDHEVLDTLSRSVTTPGVSYDASLRRLCEIRQKLKQRGVWVTADDMEAAINFGRE